LVKLEELAEIEEYLNFFFYMLNSYEITEDGKIKFHIPIVAAWKQVVLKPEDLEKLMDITRKRIEMYKELLAKLQS